MELDGWPVGSQVYLEKWVCPGLGRAIPDLLLKLLKLLQFRRVDGGTCGKPGGTALRAPRRRKPADFYHRSMWTP